ncbi:MAG: thiamine-phosphate kinase [Thiomicrorhabdus sp.]|nr:thiamine-phosphate kinase [Thiomicrorhabdus sp.]
MTLKKLRRESLRSFFYLDANKNMALEFDLIDTFFTPLSQGFNALEVGIGDDGAVLNVPENHQLVVVTDTLVSGVHFPVNTSAYDIAWKALAVNLSDLAAMGAVPAGYSLALTLPEYDATWLQNFSEGLRDLSTQFTIPLMGGDTTKGPLTITITAQGWVPNQQAILRSGAQLGDCICVTNTLGDGALGLKLALNDWPVHFSEQSLSDLEKQQALDALNRPMPQLAASIEMRGLVNSAIDISDGLLADLGHILTCSNVRLAKEGGGEKKMNGLTNGLLGADIELTQLPISSGVARYIEQTNNWGLPLSGGDDYQLCLTLNKANYSALKARLNEHGIRLTVIGSIVSQAGVRCVNQGRVVESKGGEKIGYCHF